MKNLSTAQHPRSTACGKRRWAGGAIYSFKSSLGDGKHRGLVAFSVGDEDGVVVRAGEDGHVARQFFRAWGENWKKATPVWLILLAVAALCGFDLYMARLNDSFLWELLAVFALQLAAMVMTFAFPLMARYENTWRNHLKNAMLVAVGHLPRMLLIWAVWAVPVGVSVFIPEVGFYLSIVWVLIGYSSLSYVTALLLRPVFRSLDENA